LLRAVNASDLDAVMAVWDDQGVLMPPGRRSVHGRAAISAYFHRLFAGGRFEFVFTSSQVAIEGTLAVERVDYEASAWTRQEGVAQRDYGKGVHVYRQQRDGSWQLLMDIWNSDASA
jgi:ketosteroid isomerase-like protein